MKIFKRSLMTISILLLLTSLYFIFVQPIVEVKVSQQQINEPIQKKMPFKKNNVPFKLPLMKERNSSFIIDNVKIEFLSTNENENGFVQVVGEIFADIEGSTVSGNFDLYARLRFDNSTSGFYLSDIQFNSVDLYEYKLSQKDQIVVDLAKSKFGKAKDIKNKLVNFFNKGKTKEEIVVSKNKENAFITKVKEVVTEKAKKHIIPFLEKIPVYTLRATDFKTSIAKLTLDNIIIQEGNALIQLNIGAFFKKMYFYIFAGVFAFVFVLSGFLNGNRNNKSGGNNDIDLDVGDMFSGFDW